MLKTGTWYKTQAERRIRVDPDADYDMVDVLNRAGLMLMQEKRWADGLNGTWTVAAQAGKGTIDLHREVEKVRTITTDDVTDRVELVSLRRIREMRQSNSSADAQPVVWYVALSSRPGDTATDPARRTLEIFREPTEAGTPTLIIGGVRGWRDFTAGSLGDTPPLHDSWHDAYFWAVCVVAQETRAPHDGPAPDRAMYDAAVERLWQQEEDSVNDAGELRGGVDELMEAPQQMNVDWNNSAPQ